MNCRLSIKEDIHWIGVNDRETTLFENYWPLEKGVAYNSYLIDDEKIAILDTVKFNKTTEYMIETIIVGHAGDVRRVRYGNGRH